MRRKTTWKHTPKSFRQDIKDYGEYHYQEVYKVIKFINESHANLKWFTINIIGLYKVNTIYFNNKLK